MTRASPAAPHAALCAFIAAAIVTVSIGLRAPALLVVLLAPLTALLFEARLPDRVVAIATWLARGGATIAALASLTLSLLPGTNEGSVFRLTSPIGALLVVLAGVFVVSRTPPGRTTLLAALGALGCAFLPPEHAWLRPSAGVTFVCLIAWLALRDDVRGARAEIRALPLALFIAITAAITGGIAILLPWAQPKVELMVAQAAFNDYEAATGVSITSRLGDVERLARSRRVALRYYADTPADLRVRVFTKFDGRAWVADVRPPRSLGPSDIPSAPEPFDAVTGTTLSASPLPQASTLRAGRIVFRSPEREVMPAPANTVAVRVEGVDVQMNPSGILLPRGPAALYGVLYAIDNPLEPPPDPSLLAVPAKVDPRLRELARSLGGDPALSDGERASRVEAWFQSGYRYSLDVGAFKTDDPLAEFLFDKKKGYCEYFATAATLLLRLSGVPARYVTGYAVKPFQRSQDHYVVRDSDAHAWTEAFIQGRGWIEVDATPSADYQAVHDDLPAPSLWARIQAAFDEATARVRQGGAMSLVRALVRQPLVPALAIVAFIAWRSRRRTSLARASVSNKVAVTQPLRDEMKELLGAIDSFAAARGRPRPRHRGPVEHIRDPNLPLSDSERAACAEAVRLFYDEVYGGRMAAADEASRMARDLKLRLTGAFPSSPIQTDERGRSGAAGSEAANR